MVVEMSNATIKSVGAYVTYAHMKEGLWLFCEFNISMTDGYHGMNTL